jgi:putative phage-type endonuclease
MKLHNDIIQGSDEWFAIRKQYPLTASNAQAIGNQGKGLETLCYDKMAERYSKGIKEQYTNEHTERGQILEDEARTIYEMETGNKVTQVGFVTNEEISKVAGASPDGLVNEDGLIEIKCFADTKHFKMILEGLKPEPQYVWQMQMQMLITEREWVDFVAYNPNYEKSILVTRVVQDKVMQEKIKTGLVIGEKILNEIINKIK